MKTDFEARPVFLHDDIQEQGFIPLYTRDKLTDALHTVCGFETDYKFITKRQMKNIQKKSKGRV